MEKELRNGEISDSLERIFYFYKYSNAQQMRKFKKVVFFICIFIYTYSTQMFCRDSNNLDDKIGKQKKN